MNEKIVQLGKSLQKSYSVLVANSTWFQLDDNIDLAETYEGLSEETREILDKEELPTAADLVRLFSYDNKMDAVKLASFVDTFSQINTPILKLFVGKGGHPQFRTVKKVQELMKNGNSHIPYLVCCFLNPQRTWTDSDVFMLVKNGKIQQGLNLDFSGLPIDQQKDIVYFEFPTGYVGHQKLQYLQDNMINFGIQEWTLLSNEDQLDLFSAAFVETPKVIVSALQESYPRVAAGYLFINWLISPVSTQATKPSRDVDFTSSNREYWCKMFPELHLLDKFVYTMDKYAEHNYTMTRNSFFVAFDIAESVPQRVTLLTDYCNDLLFKLNRAAGVETKFLNILKPKIETAVDQDFNLKILKEGKADFKLKQKYLAKSSFDGKQNAPKAKVKNKLFKRAFPADNEKKKKKDQHGMKCTNCGLTNHRFEDCFKAGGGKDKKKKKVRVDEDSDS